MIKRRCVGRDRHQRTDTGYCGAALRGSRLRWHLATGSNQGCGGKPGSGPLPLRDKGGPAPGGVEPDRHPGQPRAAPDAGAGGSCSGERSSLARRDPRGFYRSGSPIDKGSRRAGCHHNEVSRPFVYRAGRDGAGAEPGALRGARAAIYGGVRPSTPRGAASGSLLEVQACRRCPDLYPGRHRAYYGRVRGGPLRCGRDASAPGRLPGRGPAGSCASAAVAGSGGGRNVSVSGAENKQSSGSGDFWSRGGRSPPLCSSGKSIPSGPISGRTQNGNGNGQGPNQNGGGGKKGNGK